MYIWYIYKQSKFSKGIIFYWGGIQCKQEFCLYYDKQTEWFFLETFFFKVNKFILFQNFVKFPGHRASFKTEIISLIAWSHHVCVEQDNPPPWPVGDNVPSAPQDMFSPHGYPVSWTLQGTFEIVIKQNQEI